MLRPTELALAHLAKGERDVAELLVSQALKQNPNSASAWRAQGLISLQKGDDAEAFRAFEKAAQLREQAAKLKRAKADLGLTDL